MSTYFGVMGRSKYEARSGTVDGIGRAAVSKTFVITQLLAFCYRSIVVEVLMVVPLQGRWERDNTIQIAKERNILYEGHICMDKKRLRCNSVWQDIPFAVLHARVAKKHLTNMGGILFLPRDKRWTKLVVTLQVSFSLV